MQRSRTLETIQAIQNRVSCRSFLEKTVPKEILESVIDAGRRAPSANNLQPVDFIVVTDSDMRHAIAATTDYGRFIKDAPVCIVVIAKNTRFFLEDGCAAVENMLLAAVAQGLGACWVAGDKKNYAKKVLNLLGTPVDYNLIALIPLGWPKTERQPHEKRPLSSVLHWEKF